MAPTTKSDGATNISEYNDKEGDRANKLAFLKPLLPLAIVGLIDAISFMIVAPSLVFYVAQVGGSREQYGIILSMFSFSAFIFKPVLGHWSDSAGGIFRLPYLSSLSIAVLGSFLYFVANAFEGNAAIALILIGRMLAGLGGANSTLAFTYIALVVPSGNVTQANAILSMVRIFGMAAAPGLNALLHNVDATIQVGNFLINVDPLNSVGLVLILGNALAALTIYFMLQDPPRETVAQKGVNDDAGANSEAGNMSFLRNILRADIIVPILAIFAMNANFQLLETGLAPCANDALGWLPTAISALFGLNAFVIFFVIVLTFQLAAMGFKDLTMIKMGLLFNFAGYLSMYLFWKREVTVFMFAMPVVISSVGFPFIGAPTRSLYTAAVSRHESLHRRQGTMQAILSMSASVAGFVAPSLIASYIIRKPEEVDASRDNREFTPWALFAPLFSAIVLAGIYYIDFKYPETAELAAPVEEEVGGDWQIDERLGLLGAAKESYCHFHPRTEAARRHSITLMQIPQFSFHHDPPTGSQRHTVAF